MGGKSSAHGQFSQAVCLLSHFIPSVAAAIQVRQILNGNAILFEVGSSQTAKAASCMFKMFLHSG